MFLNLNVSPSFFHLSRHTFCQELKYSESILVYWQMYSTRDFTIYVLRTGKTSM